MLSQRGEFLSGSYIRSRKQKEISEVLGYSRENVNKCLNDFTTEGFIKYTDEKIEILNIEGLESIRKFG